jgi:hypothetical protein
LIPRLQAIRQIKKGLPKNGELPRLKKVNPSSSARTGPYSERYAKRVELFLPFLNNPKSHCLVNSDSRNSCNPHE